MHWPGRYAASSGCRSSYYDNVRRQGGKMNMKHLIVALIWLLSIPVGVLAQEQVTSQTERNKAQVMRFYEEAWHNDNYAVADEIFAPNYIRHDASDPVQGPGEAILQSKRTREVKTIMPDLRFEYDVIMADGEMVAVRWTSRGNPAGVPGFMRQGRVVELWNNRDDLTIQREMGVFRWYALGGFLIGVLITLFGGWAIRRRRSAHGRVDGTEPT